MIIELKDVNYIYDKDSTLSAVALSDINLQIREGVLYALIGHTGSGKSTLIQHMNGLIRPSSGEVLYKGVSVWDRQTDMRALRSKVGLVFQYPEHQLFESDCFKDVCFGPKNLGLSQKEVELRAYEALKQVGFDDDYFYQSPFDLSGGQKRRVAIAGVLAMKPEILILDEPTAGLDPKGREDILNLISDLHKTMGITIILVSHSMEDVADYVERIIVMNKGRVAFDAEPREVFSHYKELEEIGLAAPQVTYCMQELKAAGFDVSTDITTLEEAKKEILKALGK